jgi:hypothetical protein
VGSEELAFLDGISGALLGAGAAADANVRIDYVLVFALGNSLDGALLSAGTALQASIGDIVSHEKYLLLFFSVCIHTMHLHSSIDFQKCNSFFRIFLLSVYFLFWMAKLKPKGGISWDIADKWRR